MSRKSQAHRALCELAGRDEADSSNRSTRSIGECVPARKVLFAASSMPGYTAGMKTAISIPDPIYREAEKLARRLKKSRSQLYAEAMTAFLRRHDADAVTEALNRVCEDSGPRVDPFVDAAARRLLSTVEW